MTKPCNDKTNSMSANLGVLAIAAVVVGAILAVQLTQSTSTKDREQASYVLADLLVKKSSITEKGYSSWEFEGITGYFELPITKQVMKGEHFHFVQDQNVIHLCEAIPSEKAMHTKGGTVTTYGMSCYEVTAQGMTASDLTKLHQYPVSSLAIGSKEKNIWGFYRFKTDS